MSNKIVQLKDKTFTDNIYPIAGGMAADSITTQMLKDNSVTSDKIDWTTSDFSDNGVSIRIFGNLVIGAITFSPSPAISMQQLDGNPYLLTTLPLKPISTMSFPVWAMNTSNGAVGNNLFVLIDSSNGRVYLRNFSSTTVGVSALRASFVFLAS